MKVISKVRSKYLVERIEAHGRRGTDLPGERLHVAGRPFEHLPAGEEHDGQRSLPDRSIAQQLPDRILVEVDPAMGDPVSLQ
jgi:hypothetical protein